MSVTAQKTETRCDVMAIGGGPAGFTIAAPLAERGHDVVLQETGAGPTAA